MEPPLPVVDILKGRVVANPPIDMVGSVRFTTLVLNRSVSQVHPTGNSGRIVVYRNRFAVVSVNPKIEFCQVNKTSWPECQCDMIDEATVVADLDKRRIWLVRPMSCENVRKGRCERPSKTHPGRNKAGMNHVEFAVEMLKTKVDIVNFTPE